jgi:5'-3' exonuclease
MGFFYRTLRMVDYGIKPAFVFDGKPPELKSGTLKKRFARREEATEEGAEAKETGPLGSPPLLRGGWKKEANNLCSDGDRDDGGHGQIFSKDSQSDARAQRRVSKIALPDGNSFPRRQFCR